MGEEEKECYIATYPFLGDFELRAIVNKKDGQQQVEILHKSSGDTDRIGCIHVAVSTITLPELEKIKQNPQEQTKLIHAISSESFQKEVILSPKEHFVALKSWTQGIAESGMDAFKLQSDIDTSANFATPMINILCKFVYLHSPSLILDFIKAIDRECMFNGSRHIPSFVSNMLPILRNALRIYTEKNDATLIQQILEMHPPNELFSTLSVEEMEPISNFMDEDAFAYLIYRSRNTEVITEIIQNLKHVPTTPAFFDLFNIDDPHILAAIASNPIFVHLPEYSTLFTSSHIIVLAAIAENPSAKSHPLFPTLFTIPPKEIVAKGKKWYANRLSMILAKDPENCRFKEYAYLFQDKFLDEVVAAEIASNPRAPIMFPELYKKLFLIVPDAVTQNKNAVKFKEEYRRLFALPKFVSNIGYPLTKSQQNMFSEIALAKGSANFNEYRNLFQMETANEWLSDHQFLDIFNLNAMEFAEFNDLLLQKKSRICTYVFDNPYLIYYPAFQQLLRDDASINVRLSSPIFTYYPEMFFEILRSEKLHGYRKSELLQSPLIINFPHEIQQLLCSSKYLYRDFAANPQAVFLPEIYIHLFRRIDCWESIAANPNAVIFGKQYQRIFERALQQIDYCDLSQFAANINAPVLFPHEYRKLFDFIENGIINKSNSFSIPSLFKQISTNPNAAVFPEYARLFAFARANHELAPCIISNPNAAFLHPSLFKDLIDSTFNRVKDNYSNKFTIQTALEAACVNYNIGYYGDLIAKQLKMDDDPEILTNFAMNPFFTKSVFYPKIVFKYMHDYKTLTGAAANPNVIHFPEFKQLLKLIDTEKITHSGRVMDYDESSVVSGLAENPMMPILYPKFFEKILYSKMTHARRYAFGNPNAFPLIFPHILRHNRGMMVNAHLMPIYTNYTWLYYRIRNII